MNHGPSRWWNPIQGQKEMSYQVMRRHGRTLNAYHWVKNTTWKDYVPYDSNCMTFWKRQNYKDNKEIIHFPGLVLKERWIVRSQRIFRTAKILCVLLWWGLHAITHLSKHGESTAPKVSPELNYGLWEILMCLCRFILGKKKMPFRGEMSAMGEAVHVWGQ